MNEIPNDITKELDEILSKEDHAYKLAFRRGVEWLLNQKGNRTIYADGVDYQHELGETNGEVFASKEQTLEYSPCSEECGIVKCLVIPLEWVHPQDLSYKEQPEGEFRMKQNISLDKRIEGLLNKMKRYLYLKQCGPLMDKINTLEMVAFKGKGKGEK
jgi:hypothetical protein